jgi:hypothetical protein
MLALHEMKGISPSQLFLQARGGETLASHVKDPYWRRYASNVRRLAPSSEVMLWCAKLLRDSALACGEIGVIEGPVVRSGHGRVRHGREAENNPDRTSLAV